MTVSRFKKAIEKFHKLRVLCIGDVMLDRFIYGTVDRLSPEAPVPVLNVTHSETMLGGAGNVARNLVNLGAETSFFSVIGGDSIGHEITSMIGKLPRLNASVLTDTHRASTSKLRYVANGQQLLRTDYETTEYLRKETRDKLLNSLKDEIEQHHVVIISDYAKGLLDADVIDHVIKRAQKTKKPVIVDPKPQGLGFDRYAGATVITPNLKELASASINLPAHLTQDSDIVEFCKELIAVNRFEHIIVTRGRDGMSLVSREEEAHHIPSRAQEVVDVSGAGDTVVATLALALGAGLSIAEASYLANLAAGVVVSRIGTSAVSQQDLRLALVTSERIGGINHIVAQDDAAAMTQQWKREGKVVGFTNGCFDLFHGGHLQFLHKAREHCDKLIVGLNSDASIARIKGDGRPLHNELDRAMILAALPVVDAVVLFNHDHPLELIRHVEPDRIIKGSDYVEHDVVGAQLVKSYGGKVVIVPRAEGYSTTSVIEKVKAINISLAH